MLKMGKVEGKRRLALAAIAAAWLVSSMALAQTTAYNLADHHSLGEPENVVVKGTGDTATLTLGPRTNLSEWSRVTSLTAPVSNHGLLRRGNRLYQIGGQRGDTVVDDVLTATIASNGAVSSFTPATTKLPAPRGFHGVARFQNTLYVVGGDTPDIGQVTASVLMSTIGSDGQPGSWTETTPLPEPRDWLTAFASGGYLYAIAGAPAGDTLIGTNSVFVAPILADGKIGEWRSLTGDFRERFGAGGFALGTGAWIVGGIADGSDTVIADTRRAELGPGGAPGDWAQRTPLPEGRGYIHASSLTTGARAYVMGGQDAGGFPTTAVTTASVLSAGSLADWEVAAPLPVARSRMAAAAADSAIIVTGGLFTNENGVLTHASDVLIGRLTASDPPENAPYGAFLSPVIDLGREEPVGRIEWSATTVENGGIQLQLRLAPASALFGEWTALTSESPITVPDTVRYLQYRAVFTANGSTAPELTGITRIAPAQDIRYGDINGDRTVNVLDAVLALRIAARFLRPTDAQLLRGDIAPKPGTSSRPFGDGTINILDGIRILRVIAGLETIP